MGYANYRNLKETQTIGNRCIYMLHTGEVLLYATLVAQSPVISVHEGTHVWNWYVEASGL